MNLSPEESHFGPWTVKPLETFVQLLMDKCPDTSARPCIVAVDGRSASGKSTLAAALNSAISGSAIVRTDDAAWHHSFFDWTQLLSNSVLEPIHAGQDVSYRPPAWEERNREGSITVPQGCSLLILEGVGAARRELMHLLDLVIWIQADLEEAKARGIERDGGDTEAAEFWEEWMSEEFPFLADQRPWERADVVVNGTPEETHDPLKEIVIAQSSRLRTGKTGKEIKPLSRNVDV